MQRILFLTALLALGAYALSDISTAHGGSYRGPGDTVPPGGSGGGGGGTGPAVPGGSGPTTGTGAGTPGPSQPRPGATTGGTTGKRPLGPGTGAFAESKDGSWETWWGFNKDAYLQLKAAVHRNTQSTGGFWNDGAAAITLRPSEETIRAKVVPALTAALKTERSNDIVTGALIALAKIGDRISGEDGTSEFEPLFVPFLKDANQEIAETSAVALGILANEAAQRTLADIARDNEGGRALVGKQEVPFRTRAFATYGLGLLGARTNQNHVRQEIVRTLVEVLETSKTSTRDVKVSAVIALGLVPVDPALEGQADARSDVSRSRQSQIDYLIQVFHDDKVHDLIRAHVPTALARLCAGATAEDRDAVAAALLPVLGTFSKHDKHVIQSSALALGVIGSLGDSDIDSRIRSSLTAVIKEKRADQQARNFAVIALAQLGGRGSGENTDAQRENLRAFLLDQAARGDSHLRPWAGMAVGVMERAVIDAGGTTPLGVRETLRSLFADARAPDAVGALAIGLGIARDTEAVPLLLAKLEKNSDPVTQGYLCVALGLLDSRAAVPTIEALVKKSRFQPVLMQQAAIGLGLLGDKELVPELVTLLTEAQSQASQAAVASALGFIGDARSIDPLVTMLQRKDGLSDGARGFAAVALGIVSDKEMLPWNSKISANINYVAGTTTLTDGSGAGILDIL
ncbi:MAG: HEAT repeat domain-containing protein [Planctomycetes bacterium]|nr:HEAT repeat domain-containing protein [Planctomycetota bacterium]